MSFQAMAWASKQRVGGVTGKAILLMLANYADQNGRCIPGQNKLAEECECSPRAIREWLSKFEAMGLLRREERRRNDGYRTSDLIILRMDLPAANAAEISPAASSPENGSPEPGSDLTGSKCRAINRTYQGNRKKTDTGRERANEFAQFYAAYPRHVGKGAAERAFSKARKVASFEMILAGAERYASERAVEDPEFTKHPATWLNGQCWLDEPKPALSPRQQPRGSPPRRETDLQRLSREMRERNNGETTDYRSNFEAIPLISGQR